MIGLREGVEASLIVGIIAAFLRQEERADALDIHLLRRGYNFTDGIDPRVRQLDAGLFFIVYQRDPRAQFIPMQNALARRDALNEYIKHVGSAAFAVPPGTTVGGFIGEGLLA